MLQEKLLFSSPLRFVSITKKKVMCCLHAVEDKVMCEDSIMAFGLINCYLQGAWFSLFKQEKGIKKSTWDQLLSNGKFRPNLPM